MKRKEKAPVFKISIDASDKKTGVNLISFVSRPAIEADFIALSEQKSSPFKFSTEAHKQILTGPVLIPDKQIFRMNAETEDPFYIQFAAETIEQIRNKFHKESFTHATNDEHEISLDGNYVVESWIISDTEKDKAVALGLSGLPVGTWMVSYHVPDADYWTKEILSGNKRGFSLEGFFNYEEVKEQLSKIEVSHIIDLPKTEMKKNVKKPGLVARLMAKAAAWIAMATMTLEDGSSIEVDEETKEVFSVDAEGVRGGALPDGTYTLEDGTTIEVADGKLKEKEAEPEEKEAELSAAKATIEALTKQLADETAAKLAAEKQTTELEAKLKAEQEATTKLATEKQELETKLSKQPGANKVKLGGDKGTEEAPTSKAQSRLEQLRAQNKKK